MKKFNKLFFLPITILITFFCSLFYLSTLDYKIHDLFLLTKVNQTQNDKFILISIDDTSIKYIGYFPFNRNTYADLVYLLKENGVNTIVFDLNFSEKSNDLIADKNFATASAFCNNVIIPNVFTNSIPSFDNTNIPSDIYSRIDNKSILKFTKVFNDNLTKNYAYELPIDFELYNSCKSAGFINYKDDNDGYLRRIDLISRYKNNYYGQLIFSAILNYFKNPEILISDNKIILKNVEINGVIKDITIPRSKDGSLILKYPNLKFNDYNTIPAVKLLEIIDLEKKLREEILFLNELGFFNKTDDLENPYNLMNDFLNFKNSLLDDLYTEEGDPKSYDDYMDLKYKFYNSVKEYLNGNSIDWIFELYTDENDKNSISKNFMELQTIFNSLSEELHQLKSILNNSICTIGTSAKNISNHTNTYYEKRIPYYQINQTVANMIYSEDFTDNCQWWVSFLIALFVNLLFTYIFVHCKNYRSKLFTGFSFIFLTIIINLFIFILTNLYIGLVVPLISLIVLFIINLLIDSIIDYKQKSFITNIMGRYVSKNIVNELMKNPEYLNFNGVNKNITCMITNIQDFEEICSNITSSQKIVKLLNEYYTAMSNIILAANGTITKFEGDSIICFFGAPIPVENHGEIACKVALEMKKTEIKLNKKLMKADLIKYPLFTRIGINTGYATIGNMGSNQKFDYTMIGKNVTVTSKLEEINKIYNTRGIIISENTKKEIGDKYICRSLEKANLLNEKYSIKLYELLAENNNEKLKKYVDLWEDAIVFYEKQDYSSAIKIFNNMQMFSKNDDVLNFFINQCNNFIENLPVENEDVNFDLPENNRNLD